MNNDDLLKLEFAWRAVVNTMPRDIADEDDPMVNATVEHVLRWTATHNVRAWQLVIAIDRLRAIVANHILRGIAR